MILYIVTIIVFILIMINYFLGSKLYKEPSNSSYFSNVANYNVIHQKDIMSSPIYVCIISSLLGIFVGIYLALGRMIQANSYIIFTTVCILFLLYLVDISRKISLNNDYLQFEKLFCKTKKIPLNAIDGMYIYSFNKRFLNKNAFTTKLVVVNGNEKYKFTLAGINVRAVLNMMKENFGITENKMYIAQKRDS